MTPNQQQQKDRARQEAEHHLKNSAVDRMREKDREEMISANSRMEDATVQSKNEERGK